ncbi:MAG: circularly permuted type 2 ATP-grasp protein [Propionibacteriaceae bacterium]|nr:circularly permuted type 2 ATP-grasp protein [Propionibacteriaceae bacterium]
MSVPVSSVSSGVLDAYRRHPARGGYDELVDATSVRPHYARVADTIESLGLTGLLAARAETRNLVADEGVTYGSVAAHTDRRWAIDPIPLVIAPQEWTDLERGLAQRAQLLDLILSDLYTERTLLRRRILPAAAVLSHPGFLRQADRVAPGPGRQLMLTATDLARDDTGRWRVISDRTQAPTGAGYAMVTRHIVSRVMAGLHRSSDLARLRGFFHTMAASLMDAAPSTAETPRVVVLSPGSTSESAFDLSYLATMLGFPVAEADDLVTSHGRAWLRAGDRLEPVEVILRRVDAVMSDPLEFRGNSEIGLPGMIEAARNGLVTLANPVGAGVLDNPALIAHLGPIAEALLGEAPLLDSPPTWWCGDRSGLSHVLANLDSLVIKPTGRGAAPVRYGWELSSGERAALAEEMAAEPWAWCGQEPLELSTAPVVTKGGLEPRRFVLRAFGVAADRDYEFLPGGLGRVTSSASEYTVSNRVGTATKDVWVPASAYVAQGQPSRPRLSLVNGSARPVQVTPRVAGTLLAIGRHAERAESTARLLKVADDLTEDHGSHPGTPGAVAMALLNESVTRITGIAHRGAESPLEYLRRVTLDPRATGGVNFSARILVDRAQQVRDLMSVDTWSVLGRLERTLAAAPPVDRQLQPVLDDVLESLLAYAGIMAQSMVRDSSWAFLDAGGRLERALHTLKLVRIVAAGTAAVADPMVTETAAEAVLRSCESIITHRRRAAAGLGPAEAAESVVVLLIQDVSNPRSVAHQLTALAADLRLVGDESLAARSEALLHRLPEPASDLLKWLDQLIGEMANLETRISARHFVRQAPRHTAESAWDSWGGGQ